MYYMDEPCLGIYSHFNPPTGLTFRLRLSCILFLFILQSITYVPWYSDETTSQPSHNSWLKTYGCRDKSLAIRTSHNYWRDPEKCRWRCRRWLGNDGDIACSLVWLRVRVGNYKINQKYEFANFVVQKAFFKNTEKTLALRKVIFIRALMLVIFRRKNLIIQHNLLPHWFTFDLVCIRHTMIAPTALQS